MRRPADNPFRSDCIDSLPYLNDSIDVSSLVSRFKKQQHASLLGQHGSGKTCLLLHMQDHLQMQGFECLHIQVHDNERSPSLRSLKSAVKNSNDAVIIIDGADSLPFFTWHYLRILCRKRMLLITSHEKALLPILHRQQSDPAILQQVINQLYPLPQQAIFDLWQKHRGNIRDCLRNCYFEWIEERI